jgi:hypothetical protein
MPPVLGITAFILSASEAFRYRIGSPYFGNRLVHALAFLLIPVPDGPNAGQSGIKKIVRREKDH